MAVAKAGRAPEEFVPDYGQDVASEFELWLIDVNDYMSICKVAEAEEKKSLFMNLAGLNIRRIAKGLVIPTPPALEDGTPGDTYKALTDAVQAHFRPSINTTSERHKFRQLKQGEQESVTAFVGRLRAKVELCDFESIKVHTVTNGQLRDQLIVGIKSNEISKELLKEATITLAQAVTKAVALEASIADSSLYEECHTGASAVSLPSTVNRVSLPSPIAKGRSFRCKYCGRQHAKGKQHCPAADAQCTNCKKMGPFGSVCFQKKQSVARAVQEEEDVPVSQAGEQLNYIYDTVYVLRNPSNPDTFATTLTVNGKHFKGLLDTGATRTLITEDIVTASRPSSTILKAYDGNTVKTLGVADVTVRVGDVLFLYMLYCARGKDSVVRTRRHHQTAVIVTSRGEHSHG